MNIDRSLDDMIMEDPDLSRGRRGGGRVESRGRPYDTSKGRREGSRDGRREDGGTGGQPGTRVYVGNLSWQSSWQDLKDHMRQAGNVVYADVFTDDNQRSKGCGIVEYANPEEAQNAIRTLNDTTIKETDRLIFVREDRESRSFNNTRGPRSFTSGYNNSSNGPAHHHHPSSGGGSFGSAIENTRGRKIFVGNLPYSTSWQDLKDHYRSYGNIIRADALIGHDGRPKGQGTVLFETVEEAEQAIQATNDTEFQGRILNVHEDKFAR